MRRLRMGLLVLAAAITGCSSNGTSGSGGGSTATTEMSGTWNVSGTGTCTTTGCSTINATYTVKLVSSPCTVMTPVGTFSVGGNTCFIANNNTQTGSIAGTAISTSAAYNQQGVLVGVAADPVPDNSTINVIFVSGVHGGKFTEFTGTATVAGGKMTAGTGACSTASTASCTGASATFTATHQ